jgi:uncharacterized membrane protein
MWDGFHDMTGWGWLMMSLGLVFWISVIALAVWAISHYGSRSGGPVRADARDLLDARLARGEIGLDEHARLVDALGRGKESR